MPEQPLLRERQRECGVDMDRIERGFDCHEELLDAIAATRASLESDPAQWVRQLTRSLTRSISTTSGKRSSDQNAAGSGSSRYLLAIHTVGASPCVPMINVRPWAAA